MFWCSVESASSGWTDVILLLLLLPCLSKLWNDILFLRTQPGLDACVKHATWSNFYLVMSCDDCTSSARKRGTLDQNPGLPPNVRRLLRGLLLAAGIGGLVLVTLTGHHHELEVSAPFTTATEMAFHNQYLFVACSHVPLLSDLSSSSRCIWST